MLEPPQLVLNVRELPVLPVLHVLPLMPMQLPPPFLPNYPPRLLFFPFILVKTLP